MSHPITITAQWDTDPLSPPGQAVLTGLMAFNAAKLPPPVARLGVAMRDDATDALLGGLNLAVFGDTAYGYWGVWTATDDDDQLAAVILAVAEDQAARLGCRQMVLGRRASDPAGYQQRGFTQTHAVTDHVAGQPMPILRKSLAGDTGFVPPTDMAVEIRFPPTTAWGREALRHLTDRRLQRLGVPTRWLGIYVRQGQDIRGGAICYLAGDEFMVDFVWVDDSLRGQGVGLRMMHAALETARTAGCRRATVETADFQAASFYHKVGFADLTHIPDCIAGFGMTALRMDL